MTFSRDISESQTRQNLIDPEIQKAGWNLHNRAEVGLEIPVDGYDADTCNGITDYCLYRANGDVLAVVEAKRTSRDARVGRQQALEYVEKIEKRQSFRPFVFLANGHYIYFWETDTSAEREVAGFFTRENLERLLFIKQNALPFQSASIKETIVNRAYQAHAIRAITEMLDRKKRRALLVMATGTGKTRTTMALIDVLLRARRAQKILFIADRDSLVTQALGDGFKLHLPNESRTRLRTYDINRDARVFVSTIHTLDQCYTGFSPADFDVIITDEAHRTIYNKFSEALHYFDAVHIGLTATPAELVDRNTFNFFGCDGGIPTFNYSYNQAIKDGYLVDYVVYSAQTRFQRKGIRGVDLSEEEKELLIEQGIDPDMIDFEGSDLEKKVTNVGTLASQWNEIMDTLRRDASGQLPAKTIIFGITHAHAMRLRDCFNRMYPEYGGRLVDVITSKEERAQTLLDNFKKEDYPRIAISVDMLDTGVDVPEVCNLVFMKPVMSKIKFEQMIGRGTRPQAACKRLDLLPEGKKDSFLIIDFWENFEYHQKNPNTQEDKPQIPVLTSIFNTRLQQLALFLGDQTAPDALRTVQKLQAMISQLPKDSFTVKKALPEIEPVFTDDFWRLLTRKKSDLLQMKVAPLLRFVPDVNLKSATFTSKMECLTLAMLQRRDIIDNIRSVREDAAALPMAIDAVLAEERSIHKLLSAEFWKTATPADIDTIREALEPLMKFKLSDTMMPLELNLQDLINSRKWVLVGRDKERMYVEEYRRVVEEKVRKIAEAEPAIEKLRKGEKLEDADIERLETVLHRELGSETVSLDEENMLKAYGIRTGSLVEFLKHILSISPKQLHADAVREVFDRFITSHNFTARQTQFLLTVQSVLTERRKLEIADLYEQPFSNFGRNAIEQLFTQTEVKEILDLAKTIAA